jgi:hypothetical protein
VASRGASSVWSVSPRLDAGRGHAPPRCAPASSAALRQLVGFTALLTGCHAEIGDAPEHSAPPMPPHVVPTWEPIGVGVSHKEYAEANGGRVLLVYAGCAGSLDDAAQWADNLVAGFFAARGVGHVYAVQGPERGNCGYSRRPIHSSLLAAHLGALAPTGWIAIVAFGSGDLVAQELIASEHGGTARFPPPGGAVVRYYNLEGDTWPARRPGVDDYFAVYVPGSPYAERVRREERNGARVMAIEDVAGDLHYGAVTPEGMGDRTDYARRPTLSYLEATTALYD